MSEDTSAETLLGQNFAGLLDDLKASLSREGIAAPDAGEPPETEINQAYARLFATPDGGRVIRHLVEKFMLGGTWAPGASAETALADAAYRALVKEILWRVEHGRE